MKKPNNNLLKPDQFVLDQKDILFVLENIQKFWRRDDFTMLENAAYTANMELVKFAIKRNSPKVLKGLYFSIVQCVHTVETLNTLKLDSKDNPKILKLYRTEIEKIKSGAAFVEN